ncbi:hypothetical protein EVC30_104 [Rhizobium phage RHph_Y1_11]|nr:hypothetical protein EVC30_104 [Rhizobium phage RHph_Y1_11]
MTLYVVQRNDWEGDLSDERRPLIVDAEKPEKAAESAAKHWLSRKFASEGFNMRISELDCLGFVLAEKKLGMVVTYPMVPFQPGVHT